MKKTNLDLIQFLINWQWVTFWRPIFCVFIVANVKFGFIGKFHTRGRR